MIGRQVQPTAVVVGLRFEGVNAGQEYTCGVAIDNRAYCWGSNHSGQLGDGTTGDHEAPEPVVGPM
jgi:alpha-tubulin suppressor-like RCC1 family protein